MNHTPVRIHSSQRGTVLVIALVFLLLMTILALTAIGTSNLEEKMSGNLRDQHIAFQAAEAALRAAEAYIEAEFPPTSAFSSACTNGLCTPSTGVPRWETSWTNANSVAYSGFAGVSAQPRYMIEDISPAATGAAPPPRYFRITARGVGGTSSAQVLLQSIYRK